MCVDEKSPIQALDRTAPIFPMRPGLVELRTADYVRAGTTALFAALDVASGNVIGSMHARHRAIECKKFLVKLDNEGPPELEVHLILDTYATQNPRPYVWTKTAGEILAKLAAFCARTSDSAH